MKSILITGAAGFLGSHLCERFIQDGFRVIGMDNLITGSLKNIEHLLDTPILSSLSTTSANTSMYLASCTTFYTLPHQPALLII